MDLGHEVADERRYSHEAAEETRPVGAAEHAVHLYTINQAPDLQNLRTNLG